MFENSKLVISRGRLGAERIAAVIFHPFYLLFGLVRGSRPIVIDRVKLLAGLVVSVFTPLVILLSALAISHRD